MMKPDLNIFQVLRKPESLGFAEFRAYGSTDFLKYSGCLQHMNTCSGNANNHKNTTTLTC